MAVALTPYRFNAVFNQSPLNAGRSPWKNAATSALIHREVAHTAYQYPFALAQSDCVNGGAKWTRSLLTAIGQLSDVAGGHARSYFEMAPASIVCRLTTNLVAGYNTYGFDEKGGFSELKRINYDGQDSNNKEESNDQDLPGNQFCIGGEIARNLAPDEKDRLRKHGVTFYDNPQKLLSDIADEFLKTEG